MKTKDIDLQKLDLKDGDVMVCKFNLKNNMAKAHNFIRDIREYLDKNNLKNVFPICIDNDTDLYILPEETMNDNGWFRKTKIPPLEKGD